MVYNGGTTTFTSASATVPANTFSGNTGDNDYGNCERASGTITGTCS